MGIFERILRRKKASVAEVESAAHAELWNTPRSGEFLRKLGMAPDAATAAGPSTEIVDASIERARLAFEADRDELNRDIAAKFGPEHILYPFFLVPSSCWNGAHGAFLSMTLALNPYDDWNVELCADNEETARILEAPMLPYSEVAAYAQIIEETVVALNARLGPKPDVAARDAAIREIKAVVGGLRGHWVEHCRALLQSQSAA